MAWVLLVAAKPIVQRFPEGCLVWLSVGAVFYIIGAVFYAVRREYMHTVWHLFVLAGSGCHYVAVVRYVLSADAWV